MRRGADPFLLELTAQQRAELKQACGITTGGFIFQRMELAALVLAATAAGADALPYTRSAATRRHMLGIGDADTRASAPFVVSLELSPEQREQLRRVTGMSLKWLKVSPDEFDVTYHEKWTSTSPREIGRSFAIAIGGEAIIVPEGRQVIRLPACDNPEKGVFGTGAHPATRLALSLVEQYVGPGDHVLDVGTGSGILALAAALLGARHVLAVDIDPAAVRTAQSAVALNGLGDKISIVEGGIEVAESGYHLVIANIYSNIVIQLAGQLSDVVAPGGMAVISGIIAPRAQAVSAALESAGLRYEASITEAQWVGLAFRRVHA